jgi:hypothetical protein
MSQQHSEAVIGEPEDAEKYGAEQTFSLIEHLTTLATALEELRKNPSESVA